LWDLTTPPPRNSILHHRESVRMQWCIHTHAGMGWDGMEDYIVVASDRRWDGMGWAAL